MIDKTKNEAESIEHAVRMSGEFMDAQALTGRGTDPNRWTPEEYFAFVEVIVTGFVERMQELKCAEEQSVAQRIGL